MQENMKKKYWPKKKEETFTSGVQISNRTSISDTSNVDQICINELHVEDNGLLAGNDKEEKHSLITGGKYKGCLLIDVPKLGGNSNPIFRNINDIFQFKGRIRNCTYTTINKYYSKILNKDIAIKIIPKTGIPSSRLFKFVPRELDIAEDKKFGHPNIVKFLETHDIILRCYIMMEYVERGNLTDYIQSKGRLDPVTYQRFFSQLINAVDYCHSYGVCHRKLSTENCLITKDLDLKLCDFSYSRPVEDGDQLMNTCCGVMGFTAPEILMCRQYRPSMTEAWSCGVILFVMIYGAMPFNSNSFSRLLKQVMKPLKFHWYCDTPIHAIMIMYKTISPIRMRWSIREVIGHSWVTPRSAYAYNYYMKYYNQEEKGPSMPEIRRQLKVLKERIKIECVIPLQMKQKLENPGNFI